MVRRLTVLVIVAVAAAAPGAARERAGAFVHPWVLEHTRDGATAEFLVVLREQADLSPAYGLPDKTARGEWVYRTLLRTAERSQRALRAWLDEHGVRYRPFYIVNAILVRGDRALVERLAARPEVARIEGNPRIRNRLPVPRPDPPDAAPAGIEWGVARTHAPDVWALGFTGQGIVVGGQDTGVDWTHPALKGHYRGWNGASASHDYNWHDAIHDAVGNPCGNDSPVPCDDYGHGTHTIGTVVGDDGAGNQIGMAPGARWIACRNMDQGVGTPARYLECFEFFLAPYPVGGTPADGDPSKAPDVTNNSWGCPPSEGCSWDTLKAAVEAQRAAGIMTVVSAGNSGPSCGSVADPPAIYDAAYSVGATDSSDNLASFSSRGPASTNGGDPNLMKPDIVAPGVSVRSALPGGGYGTMSGTSMAGPHVAGAVALLWSADPSLRNDQAATEAALDAGATPLPGIVEGCGGDYVNGPNNSWGHGLVDVLATLTSDVVLQPVGLELDDSLGDGNGVLEPGERFFLRPSWHNSGSFTAPGVTGAVVNDGGFTMFDTAASYGDVPAGGTASCAGTGDCYMAAARSFRPAQTHWDVTFTETLSSGESHDWVLHLGDSFADVPRDHWAYRFVETVLHHGITAGCGGGNYCPEDGTTRWEMAVFVSTAENGGGTPPASGTVPGMGSYDCTPGGTSLFSDVPPEDPGCRFVHDLAARGITAGCGGGRYCPSDPIPRWQMAVFLAAGMADGAQIPVSGTVPGMGAYDCTPGGASVFADVPPEHIACRHIHYLAAAGVTAGCGGGNYCPDEVVSRAQMAVFLSAAYSLTLYGP